MKTARSTWIDATLEKSIVKVLMDALPLCGIVVHENLERMPCPKCRAWPGKAPVKGIPDIEGRIPAKLMAGDRQAWARPLAIEVKRPKGDVEGVEQADYLEKVRRDGGVAFFSRGLDDCCEQLSAAGVMIPKGIWEPKETIMKSKEVL